ncbi:MULTISPECIES: hypothetical protein [Pandoraea]|uniref:hypothetical protein n=1 Tax=Pandoraea TaxID=93217 RepID=UPI0011B06C13|nr:MULTISPECIES: hypothetical protein [Pandoraea]
MKNKSISLALRIALIIQDHSDTELREAIALLKKNGRGKSLLDYLANERPSSLTSEAAPRAEAKRKSVEETTSRAVLNLKDVDPEKFRILFEFDSMIRRGKLLSKHEDIRRFGERLSKTFEPRKSRKDTISSLMTILADRSTGELQELIRFATSFGIDSDSDEYQRLAQYLIRGKTGA